MATKTDLVDGPALPRSAPFLDETDIHLTSLHCLTHLKTVAPLSSVIGGCSTNSLDMTPLFSRELSALTIPARFPILAPSSLKYRGPPISSFSIRSSTASPSWTLSVQFRFHHHIKSHYFVVVLFLGVFIAP